MKTLKIVFKTLPVLYFLLVSCSSDDKSPPRAGFELSDTEPVQWDVVNLNSYATGDVTVYEVKGGDFVLKDDVAALMFLETGTYTITQTTRNDYGEDAYTVTVEVLPPNNHYKIGNSAFAIKSNPTVKNIGSKTEIRFINDVDNQAYPDDLILLPVNNNQDLPAKYLYDGTGNHTGTYLLHITKNSNAAENTYDWTMDWSGNDGDGDLIIDLIYSDKNNPENNAYEIRINEYTLSTGYFNFTGSGFVEEDKRPFSIYYRGKMVLN